MGQPLHVLHPQLDVVDLHLSSADVIVRPSVALREVKSRRVKVKVVKLVKGRKVKVTVVKVKEVKVVKGRRVNVKEVNVVNVRVGQD